MPDTKQAGNLMHCRVDAVACVGQHNDKGNAAPNQASAQQAGWQLAEVITQE